MSTGVYIIAACYVVAGLCLLPILVATYTFGVGLSLHRVLLAIGWGAVFVALACFVAGVV